MPLRRHLLIALGLSGAFPMGALAASGRSSAGPEATAVTEVFGDGQRFVAVALDYGRPLSGMGLSPAAFRVPGRTVTRVYASRTASPGRPGAGRYVIIELSPDDPAARLEAGGPGGRPGGSGAPPPSGPGAPPRFGAPAGGGSDGPLHGPPPHMAAPRFRRAAAMVEQIAPLVGADGVRIAPGGKPVATTRVLNLVVDDFRQLQFRDPETGEVLKYNLFTPKDYDPGQTYPLVLFMHDAGATSDDPLTTLRQGLGAVVWASPQDQAARPCFVLAPQYAGPTVDDRSQASGLLDTTVRLVEALATQYSLDRRRLYATGQSGGAMMSIAMNIRYPDLFAASYIVAGQWDPAKVAPLAKDRLWIMVSEGDLKAYPGENAITAALEAKGAHVARAVWDGRSTPEQFAAAADRLQAEGAPINYVALASGTVVPPGQRDDGGGNHINTWRIAYSIESVREWMFRQRGRRSLA